MTTLLDVESRSRADLKAVGGRLYWEHPSTEVICVVLWHAESNTVTRWTPGQPCPLPAGEEWGAHNATGFDRFAVARLGWRGLDEPYSDTSEYARRAGLPGALDALGTRWFGVAKNKAASRKVVALSTARRPTRKHVETGRAPEAIDAPVWSTFTPGVKRELGVQAALTPEVVSETTDYCVSDVEIMALGWARLAEWRRMGWEDGVLATCRAVNERGIRVDLPLVRRLLECDAQNAAAACASAAEVLGGTIDAAAVRRLVNAVGPRKVDGKKAPSRWSEATGLPDAKSTTLEEVLADPATAPRVKALCEARVAVASITSGKLRAMLSQTGRDGRLRDMHKYYGAHTGRWSHRGPQLGNMPRPEGRFESWAEEQIEDLAARTVTGYVPDQGEIDLLLRAALTAGEGCVLAVCDFSGVEGRANAWCAKDTKAVEGILAGLDAYKVAASTIFGIPYADVTKPQRQVGKVAELACGYGMGAEKFEWTARVKNKVQLAGRVPVPGGTDPEDWDNEAAATFVVGAWRELHAPIVKFWRDLEDAFVAACHGVERQVDVFTFVPSDDGKDVAAFLPSGRPIVYNGAGCETSTNRWGKAKKSPYYLGSKGHREHLYGGKICENVIQAMCRDLMADALVRCEHEGLRPVLHVHDEIVCEVPKSARHEGYELLHHIMLDVPSWARGFPIGAAGHTGVRYRK